MSTTTSTSSAPISFSGLASGLDTTSIIQKLVSLDSQPITQLKNQQGVLTSKEQIYTQLASYLTSLQSASTALSSPGTFNSVTGSVLDSSVATVTTTAGATAGSYSLTVSQLAQAQKITSNGQTDTTSALNLSGAIEINGKAVTIGASMSLTSIAQAINGLNSGVTAGIVNGGNGNAYLSIQSNQTGASNAMQFGDLSGNVLQSLGIGNGATSIRSAVTGGASSFGFSSSTAAVGTLVGVNSSGNININGTSIAVDTSTDSLQTIANNITQSGAGVTASVKSNTNSDGTTSYSLQVVGNSGITPTFADGGKVLQGLGILQQGATNEITAAKDASFKLDNATITSSTNTITTAIPGTTITLLKGSPSAPASTTVNLSQSTAGATSALQNFVSSYNQVADYISQNSQIDTSTFQTGALFGDSVSGQISNQLSSMLFQNVTGLTGNYTNLASLGLTLGQTGDLSLNTDTLNSALATNPSQVQKIFSASGSSTNSDISYITSTGKSLPTAGGYAVDITQTATKAQYVAGTAQTGASTNAETITFGGALLKGATYSVRTKIGGTLQDTVDQINSDSKLGGLLTASINSSGALQLDSKQFGSPGNFTVQSSLAGSSSDTGIGTTSQTPTTAGLDVAGTINGEAATGSGQFLTGSSGNTNTDGLEIQYTGTATGNVGNLNFSQGIATQLTNTLTNYNAAGSGLLTSAYNSLADQYGTLQTSIDSINAQLKLETQQLTAEFNNMETIISQLQAQSKSLTSLLTNSSTSTSSTSTGTSSTGTLNG